MVESPVRGRLRADGMALKRLEQRFYIMRSTQNMYQALSTCSTENSFEPMRACNSISVTAHSIMQYFIGLSDSRSTAKGIVDAILSAIAAAQTCRAQGRSERNYCSKSVFYECWENSCT